MAQLFLPMKKLSQTKKIMLPKTKKQSQNLPKNFKKLWENKSFFTLTKPKIPQKFVKKTKKIVKKITKKKIVKKKISRSDLLNLSSKIFRKFF